MSKHFPVNYLATPLGLSVANIRMQIIFTYNHLRKSLHAGIIHLGFLHLSLPKKNRTLFRKHTDTGMRMHRHRRIHTHIHTGGVQHPAL